MFDRRGLRLVLPLAAAVVVFAGCSPTPSPSPTASLGPSSAAPSASPAVSLPASPTPVPEPTPVGTAPTSKAAPCEPADLKASHALVEGAAGSRITSVVLVSGITCSVEAFPAFSIRDANGAPVIAGVSGGTGRIDLEPAATYETQVRAVNWCGISPRTFPLVLQLVVNGQAMVVTGSSFPEEDDLPPCNGAGSGPVLEANPWQTPPA